MRAPCTKSNITTMCFAACYLCMPCYSHPMQLPQLSIVLTCSGDESFTLSAPHAEALVSFLVRMAFLLGEQVKDKDHLARPSPFLGL